MTVSTKTTIKTFFETGDFPSQSNFADFIDSTLFLAETSSQTIQNDLVVGGNLTVSGAVNFTTGNFATVSAVNIRTTNITAVSANITNAAITSITSTNLTAVSANITNLVAKGTTTNDDAAAGNLEEYGTATASLVSLTSNSQTNLVSIPVSAGDWEVWGIASLSLAASTTGNNFSVGISTVSSALPTPPLFSTFAGTLTTGGNPAICLPTTVNRISTATNVTAYLIVLAAFAVSTATASGNIYKRRRR